MANHLYELPDGRKLGVSAEGDPVAQRMVVLFHPTPGAGGFDPDPAVTERAGVHIITFDRPGYGSSDPMPDGERPTVEAHADDVAAYLRDAKRTAEQTSGEQYGRVGLVGWGAGGRHALSLAARHPDLVDRVAVIGTASPGLAEERSRDVECRDLGRERSVAALAEELTARGTPGWRTAGIADGDPALAAHAGLEQRLDRMFADASAQGWSGVAADLIASIDEDWAGELGRVTAPVHLVYGTDDPLGDEKDADWYAAHLEAAERHLVPGGTRLVAVSEWEHVLGFLAPEHGEVPPHLRDEQRGEERA